jgi:microcystin-dependent protein
MPTLNTTPNQGYQLPFAGNNLVDDVARLIYAIGQIDTDIASALAVLAAKAGLASPAFTGTPTAPTAAPGTNTAQLATTAFVKAAFDALIGGAPGALDTLNELAAALGDNADYAATIVTALALKADIASVVRHDVGQALTAQQKAQARNNIGGASPAGEVAFFAMSSPPSQWLKANGSTISRTAYAELFAAIGTVFGAGDGSTTFKIPDLRGEFIRAWDDARGVDAGRVFGSTQADELKAHTHTVTQNYGNNGTTAARIGLSDSLIGTIAPVTSSAGGAETRPRNIALLACIKI